MGADAVSESIEFSSNWSSSDWLNWWISKIEFFN